MPSLTAIPWALIADVVVAVLLVVTLIYVRRFSRELGAIRASRGEFEKLIADLTKSTDQAANHLHQFKVTAEVVGRDLQARVDRAQGLTAEFTRVGDDLRLLTERAERAADQLESHIAKARQSVVATAPAPSAPPAAVPLPIEEEDDRRIAGLSALSGLR